MTTRFDVSFVAACPTRGQHRCGKCPARWGGANTAHCSGCHRTFGGVSGFDAHHRDGECADPSFLGFVLDDRSIWVRKLPDGAFSAVA